MLSRLFRMLSWLHDKAGFTRNEVKVILFLSITFLIGSGIRLYRSGHSDATSPGSAFDYSRSDSEFVALSAGFARAAPSDAPARREPAAVPLRAGEIDINAASAGELIRLPGIGPQIASRIVDFRAANGAFARIDDLTQVKGIGPKKLAKLRPFVRTGK